VTLKENEVLESNWEKGRWRGQIDSTVQKIPDNVGITWGRKVEVKVPVRWRETHTLELS